MRAIVVFHDSDAHPLARILKKGFQHCFVCVLSDGHWIRINLLGALPEIQVDAQSDYDLVDYFRKMGYTVVETKQRGNRMSKINPFFGTLMVANCVGLVKTVLGIHNYGWTPYSLYKELTK